MRAQTMVDVVPISVAHVQSLLHQKNIGVTYAKTSNFRMELIWFVPLYFVAMPQPIIIVTEASSISCQLIQLLISHPDHTLQGE
jgi:hypothetical protein